MRDDSCERCGAPVASEEGFCAKCVGWLKEPRELSEQEVVEAVQFGTAAVNSSDRIVICMGSVVLPLAIALFAFTYLTLDVYDSNHGRYSTNATAPVGPVFVVFLSLLSSLLTVFGSAVLARRRPRMAAIIAASVIGVLSIPLWVVWNMVLPAHEIYFHRFTSMPFSLEGTLRTAVVLQAITLLILLGAVYLAQMRKRQVDTARTRLAGLVKQ